MSITRRQFLEGLGLIGLVYIFTPGYINPNSAIPLRPPGAVSEKDFNIKCIRCFKCGEVCPTGSIQFGGWSQGQLADTPMLTNLRTNPCNLCMACTQACPTGALTPLKPNRQVIETSVKIGIATIIKRDCVIYNGRRSFCYLCIQRCPLKGRAIRVDQQGYPVVNEKYCVGCGQCEQICPTNTIHVGSV